PQPLMHAAERGRAQRPPRHLGLIGEDDGKEPRCPQPRPLGAGIRAEAELVEAERGEGAALAHLGLHQYPVAIQEHGPPAHRVTVSFPGERPMLRYSTPSRSVRAGATTPTQSIPRGRRMALKAPRGGAANSSQWVRMRRQSAPVSVAARSGSTVAAPPISDA